MKAKDLAGMRFGRLTAIEPTKMRDGTYVIWRCKCDCGNECLASTRVLMAASKKSCGCLKVESNKKNENAKTGLKEFSKKVHVEGTQINAIAKPQTIRKNNTSGCTGVYSYKTKNGVTWTAKIKFKRKSYHLGTFETYEEAVQARKEAEKRIYGEFLKWYADNHQEQWEKLQKKMVKENE